MSNPTEDALALMRHAKTLSARTDYATATAGFDEKFKDALVVQLVDAIGYASIIKDGNVMAVRTAETIEALIICLISTAAMSPYFDQPSHLREFANGLAKRIRRSVAAARADPNFTSRIMGARKGGNA